MTSVGDTEMVAQTPTSGSEANGKGAQPGVGQSSDRPKMPARTTESADASWRDRLRRFHLTGEGAEDGAGPLVPASLVGFFDSEQQLSEYPLVLSDAEASPVAQPLADRIRQCLEQMAGSSGSPSLLSGHASRLVWAFARTMGAAPGGVPLADVVDGACKRFLADFEVSPEASTALESEVERFQSALCTDGVLVDLGPHTPFALYRAVLRRSRGPRLSSFVDETRAVVARLSDVLRVDDAHGPDATQPDALLASLGSTASEFFNAEAISPVAGARRGTKRMSEARRARVENILAVLRAWLSCNPSASDLIVVHAGNMGTAMDTEGVKAMEHEDVLGTAAAAFDAEMTQIVEVVRAARAGRLEADGEYVEDLHDSTMSRMDWQSLTADELLTGTPVAVVEAPGRLRNTSLASFSNLLRSGRAIHVLVVDDERMPTGGGFSDYGFELGHFVIAHREAFALQSSVATPAHLISGLTELTATVRTAIAVVAAPPASREASPWLRLVSAVEARALPVFRYDPGAGPSFAHRFDVSDNPQSGRAWPVHSVVYLDGEGAEQSMECAFGFGDAAALESSLRGHFWVIPAQAWSEEQRTLDELVAASEQHPALGTPFIWVVDQDGGLARAVVSREVMMGALDLASSWRTLQELGGLNNEHVHRALEAERAAAAEMAAAEREALQAEHLEELERVRAAAAADAMGGLVDVLLNLDTVPNAEGGDGAAGRSVAAVPTAPAAQAETVAVPAAEEEEEEEDVTFDDPWIDSGLCTTCNECTNINSALFKYNGDDQAYLADLNAGTYAQMVAAALKCPARCIHPGAPRAGDDTATDELRAQAAKFG